MQASVFLSAQPFTEHGDTRAKSPHLVDTGDGVHTRRTPEICCVCAPRDFGVQRDSDFFPALIRSPLLWVSAARSFLLSKPVSTA